MQRYRLNYRLLIGLIIGFCVAAPTTYGLWRFQVDRNASRLLEKADAAEKSGDEEEAYKSLAQYLMLRPNEDEVRIRLGEAAVKLADNPELSRELRSESYFDLVEAVRRTSDHGLRRKLVDLHMMYGYSDRTLFDRALQSIEELLDAGQGDAELKGLKAQCLFLTQNSGEGIKWSYRILGYDPAKEEFDPAKAEAADQPSVYFMLAQNLVANDRSEAGLQKAERVIAQMVAANPESREAYVSQYQFLKAIDKPEEAPTALDKAFELDPTDAIVIMSKGVEELADYERAVAAAKDDGKEDDEEADEAADDEADKDLGTPEEHLEAAAKLFAEGMERYPDRVPFYDYAARTEAYRERYDEALAILDKGLKQFDLKTVKNPAGMPIAVELAMQKVDILFAQQKIDEVKAEIKMLRDLQNLKVLPLADYFQARIEMINQNWLEAARLFGVVKVQMINSPGLQAAASANQGLCHAQLGQWDLAREAYQWAIDKNPNLPLAVAGLAEANERSGQSTGNEEALQFEDLVKRTLDLPAAEQDWNRVEEQMREFVRKQAELRGGSDKWIAAREELLRAQMYVTRASRAEDDAERDRLFETARKAIVAAHAIDSDDITIQLAAPRMLMVEPKSGPAKALELLDKIIAKNKNAGREETVPYRLLRIEILYALRDEQLATQLLAATDGIDSWQPQAQAQVWAAVGSRFEQLGQLQDAAMSLEKSVELAPGQLTYRIALFELARKQADDAGMRAAQEKILELVKSKSDPDYVLTEVKRQMVAYASNRLTKEELAAARTMLDDAIKARPTWAELYVLSGQLSLMLDDDASNALKQLDLALENGPTNLNALNLQIRLLSELGRFPEARERMKLIPAEIWAALLDRTAANVLRAVGEPDKAYAEARKVADAAPNDPLTQVWFAEVASAAKKTDEAETALKKAVDLRRNDPDMWTALLNFYMFNKRGAEVESTLRQAQLDLDEEFLTLLTAQQHRLFGRFAQAETILLSAYDGREEQMPVLQRIAEFYLAWGEQDDRIRQEIASRGTAAGSLPPDGTARRDQAAPYLNRILRAANEGKVPHTDPAVAWARRQAARLLSLSGDFQDSMRAEQLLTAAVESKVATVEGQELLIDVLNRRGDPASRDRIIAFLKQLQQQRGLSPQQELLLGDALNDVGQWDAYLEHMQAAIVRHPDDPALRVGLVEKLIDRKEFANAERWLGRLANLPQAAAAVPQLRIRLAAAKGDMADVRAQLERMTPDMRVLKDEQLRLIRAVALLADNVGDHEYALKLIQEYSRRVPGNDMELARFTALYGDLDEGLAMLNQLFPAAIDDVLSVGVDVLRARRSEAPEKLDEAIDGMARRALRDDPEAARRMVHQAEVFEVQQKSAEAGAAYKQLLARDDVPKFVRAAALNNLAFLLAMQKQELDLALESANEAMDILGPISDVLDTRALVYYQRGDFAEAVKDLQLAVKMGATASKYFHLAEALLGAGDEAAAVEAWEQAESRGITSESVPEVERPDFEETKRKVDAIRTKQAGL